MKELQRIITQGTAKESIRSAGLVFLVPFVGAIGAVAILSAWGICRLIKK